MKLREFLENLNNLVKENPEALDLDVIYSSDDEGNSFNRVYFTPTKGYLDENDDFISEEEFDNNEINAICIN